MTGSFRSWLCLLGRVDVEQLADSVGLLGNRGGRIRVVRVLAHRAKTCSSRRNRCRSGARERRMPPHMAGVEFERRAGADTAETQISGFDAAERQFLRKWRAHSLHLTHKHQWSCSCPSKRTRSSGGVAGARSSKTVLCSFGRAMDAWASGCIEVCTQRISHRHRRQRRGVSETLNTRRALGTRSLAASNALTQGPIDHAGPRPNRIL